jgi:hypothetical protein
MSVNERNGSIYSRGFRTNNGYTRSSLLWFEKIVDGKHILIEPLWVIGGWDSSYDYRVDCKTHGYGYQHSDGTIEKRLRESLPPRHHHVIL